MSATADVRLRRATSMPEQELLSIARSITRREIDPPTLGDVTFTVGPRRHLELVSPVDLLLVTAPSRPVPGPSAQQPCGRASGRRTLLARGMVAAWSRPRRSGISRVTN
jgi:hypothetical protein